MTVLPALAELVGASHVIPLGRDQDPYVVDWRGRYYGEALAVVKPGSTAEVAAVVRYCAAHGIAIVPQGGNTGMCGAATPLHEPEKARDGLHGYKVVRYESEKINFIKRISFAA